MTDISSYSLDGVCESLVWGRHLIPQCGQNLTPFGLEEADSPTPFSLRQ